jgi:hypothetical protein
LRNADTSRIMAGIGDRCSTLQVLHRHALQSFRLELVDDLVDLLASMVVMRR